MLKHGILGSVDVFINYRGCGDAYSLISGIIVTCSSRVQHEHREVSLKMAILVSEFSLALSQLTVMMRCDMMESATGKCQ
jgi:uncharacterized membrane protein (UPF0136 family)